MKFRIEVEGRSYSLDLRPNGNSSEYRLAGSENVSGTASIAEVTPGVFSILLDANSFTVRVTPSAEYLEVWPSGGESRRISVADARDRALKNSKASALGPVEVRAQMPGKIVKVLVESGGVVTAGDGLIVVEAMKMQNEVKAPKDGTIAKIHAIEGATVVAGESLIVVE